MTDAETVVILRCRLAASQKYWLRAARMALAGNASELRNRVEMFDAEPLEIVQSETP